MVVDEYLYVILLAVPADIQAAFNDAYDNDHLLHMVEIPGVRDCTRYRLKWSENPDMQDYLAIYHMNDPELPRSPVWMRHAAMGRWATDIRPYVTARRNGAYRQISRVEPTLAENRGKSANSGEFVYFLQQSIPPDLDEKFNRFYDTDHIPWMLQTPGARGCSRFKLLNSESGGMPDYLAIYDIDVAELPRSPAWKHQTTLGVWPTQIRPYFTARRNGVFQRIAHHVAKRA